MAAPPVPPLPDAARITAYVLAAQTGPFDVQFDLYGDGTDYNAWIELWLDGVLLTPFVDWTLSSATGPLGTIPRPITDARVTLTTARSGTLQIVGNRRPRRTQQFAENQGVTARDHNVTYTDLVAMERERWDMDRRAIRAPPGEVLGTLPPASLRANLALMFNSVGDVIAAGFAAAGVAISAAMIPVVQAATLAAARAAMGLGSMAVQDANAVTITGGTISGLTSPLPIASGGTGTTSYGPIDGSSAVKSVSYSVVNADKRQTHALNGFGTVIIAATSGFDADFQVRLVNTGGGGWLISPAGVTPFYLYPEQYIVVQRVGASWVILPRAQRWKNSNEGGTFYVHPTAGNDANDGLSPSAGRVLATIQEAVNRINNIGDGGFTIILADGNHNVGTGVVAVLPAPPGSNQIAITGNTTVPTNCVLGCNPGGNCLNVQDGQVVTISGCYFQTGGNGSTAVAARQKAIIDLINCDYGPFPLGSHISCTTWSSINILGNYTIWGSAVSHIGCSNNAYINYGSFVVSIPSPVNFTVFLTAVQCGVINNGGAAMTFFGPGVAGTGGQRYAVQTNAVAIIQTTLPGSAPGSTATGGIYV